MNLVCLDSHYFQWAIFGRAQPSQQDRIPQAREFFKFLDEADATIVVPTAVITELLMGATPDETLKIMKVMESDFRVVEFDQLTAKVAAEIWNKKKGRPEVEAFLKTGQSLRTKMKIDVMILATAITSHVTTFYTEDGDLTTLASGYVLTRKMPAATQPSLPGFDLPIASEPLPVQSEPAPQAKDEPPAPFPPSDRPTDQAPPLPDSSSSQPTSPEPSASSAPESGSEPEPPPSETPA